MRADAVIFTIIFLLFLVGTVGAVGIPDTVIISTDKPWIVANNVDQSIITIEVRNTTSDPGLVQGATVTLLINDNALGTLNPDPVTTDSSGRATSIFKVKKKSGAAQITVSGLSGEGIQNIDHGSAYHVVFTHPLSGTVASLVPFNVSITDQYGNPVDNRRGDHTISLHVTGPAPDDCGFAEAGFAHDILSTLDANGKTSVNVRLTSRTGDNNILMDGYQSIPNKLDWITADSSGVPFSITQVVSPPGSPPTLPADGKSIFMIIYTLFDKYGNPTNGQTIWVNTSVNGEEKQFKSNDLGQVAYPYGPRSTVGEIYITAASVANSTVISTPQMVKFMDTGAKIISISANPSTMPSRDVPPSASVADIFATIADEAGNPVSGTTVTFNVTDETYDDVTYNVTAHPSLSSSSGITDADGQTTGVQFIPGSFTTAGNPDFNASATGHCNIVATWNSTTKTVPVTWKNYPYVSVSTSVDPKTIGINQTVNVTIALKGDGWALGPKPADVVIVTNLAGGVGGADRLVQTKIGEKAFIDSADSGVSISLVSIGNNPTYPSGWGHDGVTTRPYTSPNALALWNQQTIDGNAYFQPYDGAPMDKCLRDPSLWNTAVAPTSINATITDCKNTYTYYNPSSDAKLEMDFTTADSPANKALLKNKIDNFNDFGGTNYAAGINMALKQFDKVKNNGHVKALIIMGDGITMVAPTAPGATDSYWPSDWYPRASLGCFDESDSAKVATWKAADIAKTKGVTIFVLGYPTYGQIDEDTINGMVTPGQYYYVPDPAQMHHYFDVIYGQIRNESGTDVAITADFQNINVTGVSVPGGDVYSYVPSTKIGWQDDTINFTDQTSDWADHKLDFNIGTIKLKQQWNTTFQLKVKRSGLIDVFGEHSSLSFNGGAETLHLPQTFISVVPELAPIDITAKSITLTNLNHGEVKALLPVTWDTTYTGNETLTEKVYYQLDSGPWVLFDTKTHETSMSDPLSKDYSDFAQLDVTKLPPGGYGIKVVATASDAPDDTITLADIIVGNQGRTYIKLQ
jgi:hypothetical protein